jgi:MFS family permease
VPEATGDLSLETQGTDTPRAWLIVAAAFIAGFVVFGIVYSFGVFFEPMAAEFGADRATTSALFSITGAVFSALGSLTGHLSDRLGPRAVVAAGAIVMGASLVLTSFIGSIWAGYLIYGVGLGVGAACAYIPTLAIVGGWFAKRRNTALGIAAAGTGCGMLVVPPVSTILIGHYGWRMTDTFLGLGAALLLGLCAAVVAPPPAVQAIVGRSLRRVLRSFDFIMLYVSWVLATTALFVPLVYLPAFALHRGASDVAASALLSLLGGVSVVGRLGIGPLGDRIGILKVFKIAVFTMAVSYVLWLVSGTYAWLVAFSAVLGVAYGVRIAVMPGVLIEFFGLRNLGALLGIFFTGSGIAAVLGPLLAGFIVDHTASFGWGIAFALAMGALGFAAVVPLALNKASRTGSAEFGTIG